MPFDFHLFLAAAIRKTNPALASYSISPFFSIFNSANTMGQMVSTLLAHKYGATKLLWTFYGTPESYRTFRKYFDTFSQNVIVIFFTPDITHSAASRRPHDKTGENMCENRSVKLNIIAPVFLIMKRYRSTKMVRDLKCRTVLML